MNRKVIIGIIITIVILILAIVATTRGNEPVNNVVENNVTGEIPETEEPKSLRKLNVSLLLLRQCKYMVLKNIY